MNYKTINPWPVAIVGYFICLICAIISFVVFAIHNPIDLVMPDYYEQEILYQDQMERMRLGQGVDSEVQWVKMDEGAGLALQMPASHTGRIESGNIYFYRPSNASLDRSFPMDLTHSGQQVIDVTGFQSGLWKVQLLWTVGGKEYFLTRSLLIDGLGSI